MQQCFSPSPCPVLPPPHLYTLLEQNVPKLQFHANTSVITIMLITSKITNSMIQVSDVNQNKYVV